MYPEVVEKVSIPKSELDELQAKCARLEQCLEQAVPNETRRQTLVKRLSFGGTYSGADSASSGTLESKEPPEDEHNQTEGRLLADPDGTAPGEMAAVAVAIDRGVHFGRGGERELVGQFDAHREYARST